MHIVLCASVPRWWAAAISAWRRESGSVAKPGGRCGEPYARLVVRRARPRGGLSMAEAQAGPLRYSSEVQQPHRPPSSGAASPAPRSGRYGPHRPTHLQLVNRRSSVRIQQAAQGFSQVSGPVPGVGRGLFVLCGGGAATGGSLRAATALHVWQLSVQARSG